MLKIYTAVPRTAHPLVSGRFEGPLLRLFLPVFLPTFGSFLHLPLFLHCLGFLFFCLSLNSLLSSDLHFLKTGGFFTGLFLLLEAINISC